MKEGRRIIYIFIPVLAGMFALLGWNTYKMYLFEQKQVEEKVGSSLNTAADFVQNYNGSLLSNYAACLTDKEYKEKVAFGAGFTHNLGKITMTFADEDSTQHKEIKAPKTKVRDSTPVFTPAYFKAQHMAYKASAAMGIRQFDSVFRIALAKNESRVPYIVLHALRGDKPHADTIVSAPFIFEFTKPVVYCLHYTIPAALVLRHMLPYLLSTLLLCVLLMAGLVFFYRSYGIQRQLSQFRESLLGNITHELKTPLSSLQLIVDNAEKHIVRDEATLPAKHIQFAATELNRMKLLVDRILSFSKMSREQFALDEQQVSLEKIITNAIAIMEMGTTQANGTITFEPDDDIIVSGDPLLLANAIAAIIDNALKYTARPPHLHITQSHDAAYAVIAVQDNGIGIPQQTGKKIFEPFYRVPSGNVYNTPGHGLGLSFVRQVMKLHNGSVSYSCNEEGTAFYLKFRLS